MADAISIRKGSTSSVLQQTHSRWHSSVKHSDSNELKDKEARAKRRHDRDMAEAKSSMRRMATIQLLTHNCRPAYPATEQAAIDINSGDMSVRDWCNNYLDDLVHFNVLLLVQQLHLPFKK